MRHSTAPPPRASLHTAGAGRGIRPAAVRIIHPFPTLLNVAATAGLAAVASDGVPDAWLLARMLLMMLFTQSAIGAANDLFDRELDVAAKPSKPIPSGAITPFSAAVVALVCGGGAIALAATLGAPAFALAMLGLACGLAYDASLKRSVASAVPFMIAIPTLPLWVWVSLDRWDGVLWWIVPLGALIGLSLHVANTLPDIESDAAHGVRGLTHRLGVQRSKVLAWSSFGAALVLAVAIAPVISYDARIFIPTVLGGAACLIVSVLLGADARRTGGLQASFGVLGIGAAAAAVGWLAAAT
jgi:4-hydroxybenzoate polyprenyltransferase